MKAVFLSASCPEYSQSDDFDPPDPNEVDAATTALTQASLRANYSLIFGGHPTIAPLIQISSEPYLPANLDDRKQLVQSNTHPIVMLPFPGI